MLSQNRVTYADQKLQEAFDILVPKNGIIEDVINGVIKKAQIPDEAEAGKIRVYEVSNHKLFREMSREYPVISLNEYTGIVAERMLEGEAEASDKDFITCFHFQNEPSRAHGMPFKLLLVKVGCRTISGPRTMADHVNRTRSSPIPRSD